MDSIDTNAESLLKPGGVLNEPSCWIMLATGPSLHRGWLALGRLLVLCVWNRCWDTTAHESTISHQAFSLLFVAAFSASLALCWHSLRMIGGGLGACLGQVSHRASVLGKDHPCMSVYFGTTGGHGRACLGRGVNRSKMYELSSSWTSLWLRFYHCFGDIVLWM